MRHNRPASSSRHRTGSPCGESPFRQTHPYPEKVTSICTGYKVDSNESIKSLLFRGELVLARQLRYVPELPLRDGGQEIHDGDAKEWRVETV